MKKTIFFFGILISPLSQSETLSGVAKNNKNEVVYLEKHEVEKDETGLNKFIRVVYSKSDGTVFATMTSNFANNRNLPDTIFEDKRFKSKTSIKVINSDVKFEEFINDKLISSATISFKSSMVAAQGFDNFIRNNSSKLSSGPLDFEFGILQKKNFYSLTAYKKPSNPSNSNDVEYGVRAGNWLIRLFVNEFRVVYDSGTMRLKSFVGKSNILDDSGKAQDVAINYQWTNTP